MQFKCKTVNSRNHGLVLFDLQIGHLSGATTPGQRRPGINVNEEVLRIPQNSSITGTSPSDFLVWYTEHKLQEEPYPSAEMQPQPTRQIDFMLYILIDRR